MATVLQVPGEDRDFIESSEVGAIQAVVAVDAFELSSSTVADDVSVSSSTGQQMKSTIKATLAKQPVSKVIDAVRHAIDRRP